MTASILLAMFLAVAVVSDVAASRIPNSLTVPAAVLGFALSLAPEGIGLRDAAGGFALALIVLVPLYRFGALGAGDVKLMAAAGTFLGAAGTFAALLYGFALGGPLALGYAARRGALARVTGNLRLFVYGSAVRMAGGSPPTVQDLPLSRLRVPYAIAIAGGILLQQLTQHLGGATA